MLLNHKTQSKYLTMATGQPKGFWGMVNTLLFLKN
jgi:hypothetical protein